jgi:hypothetical protein
MMAPAVPRQINHYRPSEQIKIEAALEPETVCGWHDEIPTASLIFHRGRATCSLTWKNREFSCEVPIKQPY